MKPLIGINTDIEAGPPKAATIHALYFEAIEKSGGIPVLIPPMSDENLTALLSRLDGVMLIGGPDYSPKLYNQKISSKVRLAHNDRQDFDLRLTRLLLKEDSLPLLGICAGLQIMNIAAGGTLIQDIPECKPDSNIEHPGPERWSESFNQHSVKIEANSLLAKIYNTCNMTVNTSHHQAIKKLGEKLKAIAHAPDGIIEAVELDRKPFTLAVQWHPERDFNNSEPLFREFIRQAKHRG